ncbi:MAG: DUF455 family protein [Bdellovibrionales bacterium]
MEISDFAQKILFSDRLEDKFFSPDSVTDEHPGFGNSLPLVPARPDFLRFRESDAKFPNQRELETEFHRARLIHFFANHELLALEIMSYTLLKFPNAPKKFRLGLVNTIEEEQSHMRLYVNYMNELGLGFGEIPVNDFFWKSMVQMKHPSDFCASMSMVFEQANLDFARYYKNLMKSMGDEKSAEILDTVYQDEISHVGFGLHWFKHFVQPKSVFDSHKKALQFPLGLQRAKAAGKMYDIDGRKKAGFSLEYIEKLKLHSSSKERPPVLRFFNPEVEAELSKRKNAYSRNKNLENLYQSLQHIPWVESIQQDIVLSEVAPSRYFLNQLVDNGFSVPEFVTAKKMTDSNIRKILDKRKAQRLEPWGESYQTSQLREAIGSHLIENESRINKSDLALWNSQGFSLQLCKDFINHHPQYSEFLISCEKLAIEVDQYEHLKKKIMQMHYPLVLKEQLALSGRGIRVLKTERDLEKAKTWIDSKFNTGEKLLLENYFDRKMDFSIQIDTRRPSKKLKIARFISGEDCSYKGGYVRRILDDLPVEVLSLWSNPTDSDSSFQNCLSDLRDFVLKRFLKLGYYGKMGIDCFIYKDARGQLRLKPLVEINLRSNMGSLKVDLVKKIHPKASGVFRVYRRDQVDLQNLKDSQKMNRVVSNKLQNGVVFLSDPDVVGEYLCVLFVAIKISNALEMEKKYLSAPSTT